MSVAVFAIAGPLIAALLVLVTRRFAAVISIFGAGVALLAALATLTRVADGARFLSALPGLPGLPFLLVVDPLSAVLITVVAAVSTLVMLYAAGYMRDEPDQARFFAGMSLFVAAMQTLVLAGDWVLFITGWELIALASYLLIGFWHDRPGVPRAATRAFLTTRAADIGLYAGVFVLASRAGTTEIAATLNVDGTAATVASLFLLIAVMGKSAQVPLQGWLRDAMAGPTPVSALLHSATLVVAGVILLTRAFPLLSDDARLVIGIVGGLTAIVTGIIAMTQRDFKRMLASSTSSQIGLMLLALGAGSAGAAMFHLVTNAAIKSGLFLGAGMFQHARHSTAFDDLTAVGRERRRVFAAVVVASLALAGIPPLAGFWSKDAIIAATLDAPTAWLLAPLAITGTLITGVYIARALRLLWGVPGQHERDPIPGAGWMIVALGCLTGLAVVLGLAGAPLGELLDTEIPESTTGLILGFAAAVAGLIAGWQRVPERLLAAFPQAAKREFQPVGGFDSMLVRPLLTVARSCDRLDRAIHQVVLATGRAGLSVAYWGNQADTAIHRGVEGVGELSLVTARATRVTDENGIDEVIRNLVRLTRQLGDRARQLQTGLIHRELLAAAGVTVAVVVLLFI